MPEPKPGSLAQRMRERAERAEAERHEALAALDQSVEDASALAEEAIRARRERDDARAHHDELRRHALPCNCTRCHGSGAEPPGCPESGPCERCGGWTAHKRLVAAAEVRRAETEAERDLLRDALRRVLDAIGSGGTTEAVTSEFLTLVPDEVDAALSACEARGRAKGRADVGKYSRALDEIDAAVGVVGARTLGVTVDAVRACARERDALRDEARAGLNAAHAARHADLVLHYHERAERAERERDEARALADTAMLVRDTAIEDAEIRGAAWMRERAIAEVMIVAGVAVGRRVESALDPEQVCAERREREGA